MNTVYFDSPIKENERRRLLYEGNLFVFSPTASSLALCKLARELSEEAFAPLEPTRAQFELSVENYAAVLESLKPKFIHHPTAKELIPKLLSELGCDLEKTYFDVPRLRTATSDNYLTSGLAYAFHPHRDTWYSAPQCQINWWLPVYEIVSENSIAFHPRYWTQPVKNGSRDYNYYKWNKESRGAAGKQIKTDTRKQPKPEEPMELDPRIRPIPKPGGVILFSGATMHSTVPNTSGCTRFSIDFRTVNLDDVGSKAGAPNIDSECTGTTLRDFLKATDLSRIPDELVAIHDSGKEEEGVLVYQPA